jgi:hypothetical protein
VGLACALSCFDTVFYVLFLSANVSWVDRKVRGRCPDLPFVVFLGLIDSDICESDLTEDKDIGIGTALMDSFRNTNLGVSIH